MVTASVTAPAGPGTGVTAVAKCELGGLVALNQPARLSPVCYRTDTGFAVVDVWTEEQSLGAFGALLMEYTQKAGLNARPTVHRLQIMVDQGGMRGRQDGGLTPRPDRRGRPRGLPQVREDPPRRRRASSSTLT